jgi:hypothetical protein
MEETNKSYESNADINKMFEYFNSINELRCKLEYETQLRIKAEKRAENHKKRVMDQLELNNKLMAKLIEKL